MTMKNIKPKVTRTKSKRAKDVDKISSEVGNKLRQIREDLNYSGYFVADALGISHPSTIYDYEKGSTPIPLDRLVRLLTLYQYDIVQFVSEVRSMQTVVK